MKSISKQFDENLAHLAWSLWTELGVAGLTRKHQDFAIAPEELIILASVLFEFDPRLRDEALDWCIRYHQFISPIRLQILVKKYKEYIEKPFSIFSTTFNTLSNTKTKWIVPLNSQPLKYKPSGKSILRPFNAPSMIHFRLRSFLGVGACADILSFLLMENRSDFIASDLLETGYSKRRIATILSDLAQAGILFESQIRNQLHYAFVKRDPLIQLMGGIPAKMVVWNRLLAILLPIRACLHDVEDTPVGVRVIDMKNLLHQLSSQLLQMQLIPPPLQNDFEAYWQAVVQWLLEITAVKD